MDARSPTSEVICISSFAAGEEGHFLNLYSCLVYGSLLVQPLIYLLYIYLLISLFIKIQSWKTRDRLTWFIFKIRFIPHVFLFILHVCGGQRTTLRRSFLLLPCNLGTDLRSSDLIPVAPAPEPSHWCSAWILKGHTSIQSTLHRCT